jgi:hypothetical protein
MSVCFFVPNLQNKIFTGKVFAKSNLIYFFSTHYILLHKNRKKVKIKEETTWAVIDMKDLIMN